jgi:hypothetical protein
MKRRWDDDIKMDINRREIAGGGACTGSIWLRIGTQVAGSCECGGEPSGSIKCGEFLD